MGSIRLKGVIYLYRRSNCHELAHDAVNEIADSIAQLPETEDVQKQLYPERFDGLPQVAGRALSTSHADFTRACRLLIAAEQAQPSPNNALLSVLCDAVRLSREHCDAMTHDGSCQLPHSEFDLHPRHCHACGRFIPRGHLYCLNCRDVETGIPPY